MSIARLREYHPLFLAVIFTTLLSYLGFIILIGVVAMSYVSNIRTHIAIGPVTLPWLCISAFAVRIIMSIIWRIAGKPVRKEGVT